MSFSPCEEPDQPGRVRVAEMIGVEDLGPEGPGRVGDHLGRHGVGQVHRQEGDVDRLQGLHLRRVLRVAGDVDALVAEGEDVAVAVALGVEGIPVGPLVDDVVGRDGLDRQAEDRAASRRWP